MSEGEGNIGEGEANRLRALSEADQKLAETYGSEQSKESGKESREQDPIQEILQNFRENREIDGSPTLAFQDGKELIAVEIQQIEKALPIEHPEWTAEEKVADRILANQRTNLMQVKNALDAIETGNAGELDYKTIKLVRGYYRTRMMQWGRLEEQGMSGAVENKKIYRRLLEVSNEKLSNTPEVIVSEPPQFDLAEKVGDHLDHLHQAIETQGAQEITIDNIKTLYKGIRDDITEANRVESERNPRWVRQKEAVAKAREQWKTARVPLRITVPEEGEIQVEPVRLSEKITTDKNQYILDPDIDNQYLHDLDEFDDLESLAKHGVEGLKKLGKKGERIVSYNQMHGILLFFARTEAGIKTGTIDNKYGELLTRIGSSLRTEINNPLTEIVKVDPRLRKPSTNDRETRIKSRLAKEERSLPLSFETIKSEPLVDIRVEEFPDPEALSDYNIPLTKTVAFLESTPDIEKSNRADVLSTLVEDFEPHMETLALKQNGIIEYTNKLFHELRNGDDDAIIHVTVAPDAEDESRIFASTKQPTLSQDTKTYTFDPKGSKDDDMSLTYHMNVINRLGSAWQAIQKMNQKIKLSPLERRSLMRVLYTFAEGNEQAQEKLTKLVQKAK